MSIARLRWVAEQKLPLNVSDSEGIDELRVLMAAGLIAGMRLSAAPQAAGDNDGGNARVFRVLAITPEGHRLLERSGAVAAGAAAACAEGDPQESV